MFRGYAVPSGYVGFVGTNKMIFPTEDEYIEYMREKEDENGREEERFEN